MRTSNYKYATHKVIVQSKDKAEMIDLLKKYGIPIHKLEIVLCNGIYECYWHREYTNDYSYDFLLTEVTPTLWIYVYSNDGIYLYNNYRKIQIEQMKINDYVEFKYTENKVSEVESLKRLFIESINGDAEFFSRFFKSNDKRFPFTEIFIESPLFQSILIHMWNKLYENEEIEDDIFQDQTFIDNYFKQLINWFKDNKEYLKKYQNYSYQALKNILNNKKEN